jgi:hypothetical protein
MNNNFRCNNDYKSCQNGNQNWGSSNRLIYDCCEYKKSLEQSVSPLAYYFYDGKYENGHKCVYNGYFSRPFDREIVDAESELFNLTRPATKCPEKKYNPNCKHTPTCWSTFDKTIPVAINPLICPVVYNNIQKPTNPGYTLTNINICNRKY